MSRLSLKCYFRLFENAFPLPFCQGGIWKSSLRSSNSKSRSSSLVIAAAACFAILSLATTVQAQSTYTVTTVADSGTGSLRDVITQANTTSGNSINFTGLTGTILLQSALPAITQSMTITGPGANLLTISGNNLYSVFSVNSGTVGLSQLTIAQGNSASNGGAILNFGSLTVSDSAFSGNIAAFFGGAIFNAGVLTITGSSFSSNSGGDGGGIFSQASLTVIDSIFSSNSASTGAGATGFGGAIASTAAATVSNSTFSGNSGAEGGGIYSQSGLTVSNSTFSGNTTPGFGGGIYSNTGGMATANNNIFVSNTALLGAGIKGVSGSTTNANNNVFYTNHSGGSESDCDSCTSNSAATDSDPKLAMLGSYGGTTQTMLPLPGSAAICAGSFAQFPAGMTTDQRGFPLTPRVSMRGQCRRTT